MNNLAKAVNPFDGYLGELVLPGIDWAYFIERRLPTMRQEPELPAYLLLPEVEQLLSVTINQRQHFLLNTLFHTGARISEALMLTRADFNLDGRYPEISVPTVKRKRGRPKASNRPKRRLIPVLDGEYIDEALSYFASNKGGLNSPLFTVDRSTVYRWIKSSVKHMEEKGINVSIDVSPHTLRHSFAVNAVLHWVPVPILQKWLGHDDRRSTEIYTNVLQTETVHFMSRVGYKSGIIK